MARTRCVGVRGRPRAMNRLRGMESNKFLSRNGEVVVAALAILLAVAGLAFSSETQGSLCPDHGFGTHRTSKRGHVSLGVLR